MGAPDILVLLRDRGLTLTVDGGNIRISPKSGVTEEIRALIAAHKAELLAELSTSSAALDRRARVMEILASRPATRYAVVADAESDPATVILAIAVRHIATCELRIPREKWDPFVLIDLVDQYDGTVH